MCIRSRKGSLIVEATVFLPPLLLALLTIAQVMRIAQVQETMLHVLAMNGRQLAVEEYAAEDMEEIISSEVISCNIIQKGAFFLGCRDALHRELGKWISGTEIRHFETGWTDDGIDALNRIVLRSEVVLPFPNFFHQELIVEEQICCRAFVGTKRKPGRTEPFAEFERSEESRPVYVFPRTGEKYHGAGCRIIRAMPSTAVLNSQLRRMKEPCKVCSSKELSNGAIVYYYSSKGGGYHKLSCPVAEKYFVKMELDKAMETGYEACLICGGA